MRIALAIIVFLIGLSLTAQTQADVVSGSYNRTPVLQIIQDFEGQTGKAFFYHSGWVDSLTYTGEFDQVSLEEALDKILKDQAIAHVIRDTQVILTYNSRIITEFPIRQNVEGQKVEKGLIFQREYQEEKGQVDERYVVHEIGKVGNMTKGSQATVAGYVRDADSEEPVEGVLVYIQNPFIGTSTDADGFYSLQVPAGKHIMEFQSLNMKNTFRNVVVFSDGRLDVPMEQDIIALQSVVVNADRDANIENAQVGVTKFDVKEAKNVPVLLGERDMVKIATTTSGVQSVGEGSAGINVRGGKADQNLFLLDGTPIYNTSHFFGFFSVFNSDAMGGMNLYKGAIPASYGGRLSSVVDIQSKVPNKSNFSGNGGIGPVTSRLLVEVPIVKSKTSVMVGGRATYSDFVLDRVSKSSIGDNKMSFYDFIAKVHHTFNDDSKLGVSFYKSYDSFQLAADTLLDYTEFSYENMAISAVYEKKISPSIDAKFNTSLSRYAYDINYDVLPSQGFNIGFDLNEVTAAGNFTYYQNEKMTHEFGASLKRFDIAPGLLEPLGSESLINGDEISSEQAIQEDFYYSLDFEPNDKFNINAGLRYSIFSNVGPYKTYDYDAGYTTRVDSSEVGKGKIGQTYHGPEWRLSSRYMLNSSTSLKASLSRNRQYIHLLINAASIAPNDVWRLSSEHIKPQVADQVSMGVFKNFYGSHMIETSVELYGKRIQNLLDFKTGTDLQFNKSVETGVLQGPGKSYGVEFTIKKSSGWFTGWANYTFSRTFVKLEGATPDQTVNGGSFFPANYDRPHYFNSVTNYKFTRRFSLAVNMVYASGIPVTYPVGKWEFQGAENIYYSDRNQYRLPDYFRLDLGLNIEGNHKIKKLAHAFWTLSVYNVLGIDNVYSVFFRVEEGNVEGYKMTVFPNPIPTLTYNFSF